MTNQIYNLFNFSYLFFNYKTSDVWKIDHRYKDEKKTDSVNLVACFFLLFGIKFSGTFPAEKEKFLRGNLQIWFVTRDSVTYQCGVKEWQPLYGTFLRDLAEDALVTWLWCDSPRQRNNFNPRFFCYILIFKCLKKGNFKWKLGWKNLKVA